VDLLTERSDRMFGPAVNLHPGIHILQVGGFQLAYKHMRLVQTRDREEQRRIDRNLRRQCGVLRRTYPAIGERNDGSAALADVGRIAGVAGTPDRGAVPSGREAE